MLMVARRGKRESGCVSFMVIVLGLSACCENCCVCLTQVKLWLVESMLVLSLSP
jgi:hypothetical protein